MPFVCTAIFVAGLLLAYARASQAGIWATKPLASAGFLWAALSQGALETHYGRAVFIALVLSWLGDVLLIPKSRLAFLGGLVSFLAGHIAFGVAFWVLGCAWTMAVLALACMSVPAFLVGRWLLPSVSAGMRGPVVAYIVVITVMVALAIATGLHVESPLIPLAAASFFVSDLAVARERFVCSELANKLWGLPLYYGAQLVFACTVAG